MSDDLDRPISDDKDRLDLREQIARIDRELASHRLYSKQADVACMTEGGALVLGSVGILALVPKLAGAI